MYSGHVRYWAMALMEVAVAQLAERGGSLLALLRKPFVRKPQAILVMQNAIVVQANNATAISSHLRKNIVVED